MGIRSFMQMFFALFVAGGGLLVIHSLRKLALQDKRAARLLFWLAVIAFLIGILFRYSEQVFFE